MGGGKIYTITGLVNPAPDSKAKKSEVSTSQVLISIQSMILCEEPYLNEPGWASSGGTPQSRACKFFLYF
jgi:hypothetical protein